jgi:hypothetical protein
MGKPVNVMVYANQLLSFSFKSTAEVFFGGKT